MARRSFSDASAHLYDPAPFARFLEEGYGPGDRMERDLADPAIVALEPPSSYHCYDPFRGDAAMTDYSHKRHGNRQSAGTGTAKTSFDPPIDAQRDQRAFERLAQPLRREIKAHCYRMLGSVHDADDLVQDTYLRAWRGFESFEGGAFRAWLYRIATNACLNALESRKVSQRWIPAQRGPASATLPDGVPVTEVSWLEPYPDSCLESVADESPNPEARFSSREAVQLAFIASIQQLPPRQRAALLLCEVLGWAAAEAATLLGGSIASINSASQRARETLAKHYPEHRTPQDISSNANQQELLGRYLRAWEGHDLDGFVALLKEDASVAMPPWPQWYTGREAIRKLFAWAWATCHGVRLVPTAANGQPAFAVYERSAKDASYVPHAIQVLALDRDRIASVTLFLETPGSQLFQAFGLPLAPPDAAE
jgi:RNA polymerase sigma-70 factor, ECF subfamily